MMRLQLRDPIDVLAAVSVFGGLNRDDLRALAEVAEPRRLARHEVLFREGDPPAGLFVVRAGEIKVVKAIPDEREQIIYLARTGRTILEGVSFEGSEYPASAIATVPSHVLLISNDALRTLSDTRPALMRAVIDLGAKRVDRILTLIGDISLRTVPSRLASFLLGLVQSRIDGPGDPRLIVRDMTTQSVAARLGTVREEVTRALTLLEQKGILTVTRDSIYIEDVEALDGVARSRTRPKLDPRPAQVDAEPRGRRRAAG